MAPAWMRRAVSVSFEIKRVRIVFSEPLLGLDAADPT